MIEMSITTITPLPTACGDTAVRTVFSRLIGPSGLIPVAGCCAPTVSRASPSAPSGFNLRELCDLRHRGDDLIGGQRTGVMMSVRAGGVLHAGNSSASGDGVLSRFRGEPLRTDSDDSARAPELLR